MPEDRFQQMLQLLICCNYCGQQEALEIEAPPSPTVAVVQKACGLQVSPGYFETQSSIFESQSSPSISRTNSFGSNKSSSGKLSSLGSSQASTSHSQGGGGGSQRQPAECNDDEECDGGKHMLTNTELTSQAALLSCFAETAQGKTVKTSKTTVSKKQSRAEAKAKQMRGNNAASLTFFF